MTTVPNPQVNPKVSEEFALIGLERPFAGKNQSGKNQEPDL
jgi:hypothetical protein